MKSFNWGPKNELKMCLQIINIQYICINRIWHWITYNSWYAKDQNKLNLLLIYLSIYLSMTCARAFFLPFSSPLYLLLGVIECFSPFQFLFIYLFIYFVYLFICFFFWIASLFSLFFIYFHCFRELSENVFNSSSPSPHASPFFPFPLTHTHTLSLSLSLSLEHVCTRFLTSLLLHSTSFFASQRVFLHFNFSHFRFIFALLYLFLSFFLSFWCFHELFERISVDLCICILNLPARVMISSVNHIEEKIAVTNLHITSNILI